HKKYFCDGCLLHFSNENLLFQHQQNDCNHLYTSIPSREIKKDKYGAYILEPNPHYSYTNRTFRHEPYSFAYLIKYSFNDSLSKFELYRGANAANGICKQVCGICEKPFQEGERGGLRIIFVSGGPKKYAYRVFSTRDKEERVVCKVKGISLNYAASQLVNFEIIKSMILEPMSAGPVSITSRNILRTK
ncbi:hypothetical protein NQ318_000862, partial [Aromia moschata]